MADDMDRVINALEGISNRAQLRDYIHYAEAAARLRCGACQHWMKSRICPRERNVNGWNRGPSSESVPCDKFLITARSINTIANKRREASEFAASHGLPNPYPEANSNA